MLNFMEYILLGFFIDSCYSMLYLIVLSSSHKSESVMEEKQKTRSTGRGEYTSSRLRFMTVVVAFHEHESPLPTSIGSRVLGGNCVATSLYDSHSLLLDAVNALEEIQASPYEAERIAEQALDALDDKRTFKDWLGSDSPIVD